MAKENKWVKWDGGACPVPPNAFVDIKVKDGSFVYECSAKTWDAGCSPFVVGSMWAHDCEPGNEIVAYRLHQADV